MINDISRIFFFNCYFVTKTKKCYLWDFPLSILLKLKYKYTNLIFNRFITFFIFLFSLILTTLLIIIFQIIDNIYYTLQQNLLILIIDIFLNFFTLLNYFINFLYHNNSTSFILRVNHNNSKCLNEELFSCLHSLLGMSIHVSF